MHNNRHMIIHIVPYIPQKASRKDRNTPEPNTSIVHPLIALRVGDLPGRHDRLVRCLAAIDAREMVELVEQRGAGEFDGVLDDCGVGDVEVCDH